MPLPKLSAQQKRAALAKAQEMRSQRASLRRRLKTGELKLPDILQDTQSEVVARMRVAYLIQSLPQVGRIRAQQIMNEIGIDEGRRVQGLGKRQRSALLERLG
ncbi:MAG: integration host factor [Limnochordaceae bacterium]|nr:integration host factor [Limnochordaceae bacterium]